MEIKTSQKETAALSIVAIVIVLVIAGYNSSDIAEVIQGFIRKL